MTGGVGASNHRQPELVGRSRVAPPKMMPLRGPSSTSFGAGTCASVLHQAMGDRTKSPPPHPRVRPLGMDPQGQTCRPPPGLTHMTDKFFEVGNARTASPAMVRQTDRAPEWKSSAGP